MRTLKQYINITNESLLDDEDKLVGNHTGENGYLKKELVKILKNYKTGIWNNRRIDFDKFNIEYNRSEKTLSIMTNNSDRVSITIPYKDFVDFLREYGLDVKTIISNAKLIFDSDRGTAELKNLTIKCGEAVFKDFDKISNVIYETTNKSMTDSHYHGYNVNVYIINRSGKTDFTNFKCDTKIPISNPNIPPHKLSRVKHNALTVDDIDVVEITAPISNITTISVLSATNTLRTTNIFNKYFIPGVAVFHDRERDVDVSAGTFTKYLSMLKNWKRYTASQERINIFSEDLREVLNLPDLKLIEFPYMWGDCELVIDLVNDVWVPRIIK